MNDQFKRLYRSQTEARLAGVCGGLGVYLKIDPVLVRLLWVGITCLTGFVPGMVAYLIAWLIVPLQPLPVAETSPSEPVREGTA